MTIAKITIAIATMFMICKAASAQQVGCAYCPCTQRLYPTATTCQNNCPASLACPSSCISVNLPGKAPTWFQKNIIQGVAFPKMTCYSVIEDENPKYNCIADTVGVNYEQIWDHVDGYGNKNGIVEVSDFDSFYSYGGFKPSTSSPSCKFIPGREKIALYGKPDGAGVMRPKHAARQVPGGLFESKEGENKKVRHGAEDMGGGFFYGELIKCYER